MKLVALTNIGLAITAIVLGEVNDYRGYLIALNIGFVIFHAISFGRYFTQINLGFGPRTAHCWIHFCFSVSHHFRGCHQEPSIQTEDGSDQIQNQPPQSIEMRERNTGQE